LKIKQSYLGEVCVNECTKLMKIRSLSFVLAIPLVIAAIVITIMTFGDFTGRFIYVLIPIVGLVAIYSGYGQIDYWYLKRYPYPLDDRIKNWLVQKNDFYNSLNSQDRVEFENRLSNYLFAREFNIRIGQENSELAEDVKAAIASECIMITFGQEDSLLGDFDRIYFYKNAFPTPNMPFLHTYEVEKTDQMIILAHDQAIQGIHYPNVLNIALQAYIEAYISLYPNKEYPVVHDYGYRIPCEIIGQSKDDMLKTTGHTSIDILALHINAYFTNKTKYMNQLPSIGKEIEKIFNV
jgi:hypothetical protein